MVRPSVDRGADPHVGAEGRAAQLAAAGLPPAVGVATMVFNPNNPVSGIVERLELADGSRAVRKVLCGDRPTTVPHWPAGQEPDHWNYWRREAAAYDDGVVDVFAPAGLRAPRLLGRVTPADGVEVLFLELVEGRSGAALTTADVADAAGGLGVAQGDPTLAQESSSTRVGSDVLSRDWVWKYALSRPPGQAGYEDAAAWEQPVVVAGFGRARHRIRARFGGLLTDAGRWQTLTRSVPRTVAHLDCWANNLVVPDVGGPVLLDWSNVGIGLVGEDPSNLVLAGLLDHLIDCEQRAEVDATVWGAYARGLEVARWPHPPELARLGMCVSAMKFVWLPALMVHHAEFAGPTAYGGQEGLELVEVFRRRAVVFDAMLALLEEAQHLARRLRIEW